MLSGDNDCAVPSGRSYYEIMSWQRESAGSQIFHVNDKTAEPANPGQLNRPSYFVALQVTIKCEEMSVQKTVKIVTTMCFMR